MRNNWRKITPQYSNGNWRILWDAIIREAMEDTIFLLVKATIQTAYPQVHDAITEIQREATCTISDTRKVKIKKLEFMDYKLKS